MLAWGDLAFFFPLYQDEQEAVSALCTVPFPWMGWSKVKTGDLELASVF